MLNQKSMFPEEELFHEPSTFLGTHLKSTNLRHLSVPEDHTMIQDEDVEMEVETGNLKKQIKRTD